MPGDTGCAANGNIAGPQYRSENWAADWQGTHTWRASASYVTGASSMKFGYQGGYLVDNDKNDTNNQNLSYTFNNGKPNSLTETIMPFDVKQTACATTRSTRRISGRTAA